MDLSPAARVLLALAGVEAVQLRATALESEHLLLGLLKIGDLVDDAQAQRQVPDLNWDEVRPEIARLEEHWGKNHVPLQWVRRRFRKLLGARAAERGDFGGQPSERCRVLLEQAEQVARRRGEERVTVFDVLEACLKAESDVQAALFDEFGIKAESLLPLPAETDQKPPKKPVDSSDDSEGPGAPVDSPLARYGRDLTSLARKGKLPQVVGRKREIKEVAEVLSRLTCNNPLLLGDAGVGKTAIVEGLATRACEADALEAIRDLHFVEVTMSSLVAGAMYRGDFEKRLQKLLDEVRASTNLVLFVDEIHTLVGAGAGIGAPLDAANIMKPALSRGELRCIGATTVDEYRRFIEPDEALASRFGPVWISEPSPQVALEILRGLRPRLEKHHGLELPDPVLARAVDLAVRYVSEGHLPRKAIAVLDQACSRRRLLTIKPGSVATGGVLQVEDVAEVVARRTGIPVEVITMGDEERLLRLETYLQESVIGQPGAVESLARAVRTARAGLGKPGLPVVVLFAGPSGTGKTELAKALARFLFHDAARLISIDMTNFQEEHTVSNLIGSPKGYVGSQEEPYLIREIRKHPYSVVLLDEIEKAHERVLLTFMPVFDEGRLIDGRGRTINFSDAIFILTSNLGTGTARAAVGVNLLEQAGDEEREVLERGAFETKIRNAISTHLRPELLNRVQEAAIFHPLSREAFHRILDRYVDALNRRLEDRRVVVSLDPGAQAFLLSAGCSAEFGARHLQRAFNRWISGPLSEEMLAGRVKPMDRVSCRLESGRIAFDVRRGTDVETLFHQAGAGSATPPGE